MGACVTGLTCDDESEAGPILGALGLWESSATTGLTLVTGELPSKVQ